MSFHKSMLRGGPYACCPTTISLSRFGSFESSFDPSAYVAFDDAFASYYLWHTVQCLLKQWVQGDMECWHCSSRHCTRRRPTFEDRSRALYRMVKFRWFIVQRISRLADCHWSWTVILSQYQPLIINMFKKLLLFVDMEWLQLLIVVEIGKILTTTID